MKESNITEFPGLEMVVTPEAELEFLMKVKGMQDELNKSFIATLKLHEDMIRFDVGALNKQVSYLTRRVAKLEKRCHDQFSSDAGETKGNLSSGRNEP